MSAGLGLREALAGVLPHVECRASDWLDCAVHYAGQHRDYWCVACQRKAEAREVLAAHEANNATEAHGETCTCVACRPPSGSWMT